MKNQKIPFYIPNLIGYIRLLLILTTVLMFRKFPFLALLPISIANILDMLDGYAAKRFNQTSTFGSVLDYTLDRISSIVVITLLIILYPNLLEVLLLLLILDIASHFSRIYTAIYSKATHHKSLDSQYKLLQLYYTNKAVLTYTCWGYEFIFGTMWVVYFIHLPLLAWILPLVFIPGFINKIMIHIWQIVECFNVLTKERTRA